MVAATLNLTLGAVSRPFAYRKGTVDEAVVAQALTVGAYDVERLRRGGELVALYERMVASGRPPLIVDAAANIGAAAVFFTYKFPNATIIALEPDSANFALLIANTAGLPVQCIQATVASESAVDRAAPRVAVGDIYDRSPDTQPFILKFDIEADDLFALNTEWLQRTPALIASLSDYLVPGTAASRRFIWTTVGQNPQIASSDGPYVSRKTGTRRVPAIEINSL